MLEYIGASCTLPHRITYQGLLVKCFNVFTGKVCLTFFGQWSEVQSEISSKAMEQMYCAPGKNIHYSKMKLVVVPCCNLPSSGKIQLQHVILSKSPHTAHCKGI